MSDIVAEKAMGWTIDHSAKPSSLGGFVFTKPGEEYISHEGWSPSTSISAAWEVVEKIRSCGYGFSMSDYSPSTGWHATFHDKAARLDGEDGDTVPLAICRAALKAKEK